MPSSLIQFLSCTTSMSRRQACTYFMLILGTLPFLCRTDAASNLSNTLKQDERLSILSNEFIVSANSKFLLTFFKDGFNQACYYLVIKHMSTVVWVANRDTPVVSGSGALTIDNSGILKITENNASPIVLYPDDEATGSTRVATLHDDGNLVFSELNLDGSTKKILWQSFDHPTDTLLPGMILGTVDNKNGRKVSLKSRLNGINPSSGAFTLDWDPIGRQLIVRRRGVIVWASGVLKDGIFQFIPKTVWRDYTPLVSEDGNTWSFSANKTTYFKLAENGSLIFSVDDDTGNHIRYSSLHIMEICYGYNNDNGCAQWLQPKCRNDMPTFILQKGIVRRADNNEIDFGFYYRNASAGPGDCRAICWEDCDCLAYDVVDDIGCRFWKGNSKLKVVDSLVQSSLYFISANPAAPQYPTHPPEPSSKGIVQRANTKIKPGTKINRWIWIAISSLVIPCLPIVVYWRRWKRREKDKRDAAEKRKEKHLAEDANLTISVNRDEVECNLKLFRLQCLSEATNQFSLDNKLGQGGFGPVFKGTLPEGREIAVKRLSRSSGQGLEEFRNELKLIAKLQHVNLVRLLGYCIEGEEKILVYEYMPNRSLDSFLFDPSKRCPLDSQRRLKIIEGIAQGLYYLHELSRVRIIHRDLKASNILLDESLNPKISDFGMARIFKGNELMANTKRIVGTYGYMSPEYAMEGIFSVKSDVFSFGILVLEIVSGRRNSSFYHLDRHINLIGYAWELWQKEAWIELIDPKLKEASSTNQIHRMIHVGLLCVEDSPSNRPTVSEIISMLINESMPLPSVKRPAFLISSPKIYREYYSINELSLSLITAR